MRIDTFGPEAEHIEIVIRKSPTMYKDVYDYDTMPLKELVEDYLNLRTKESDKAYLLVATERYLRDLKGENK